jgi:kinesin family protein 1
MMPPLIIIISHTGYDQASELSLVSRALFCHEVGEADDRFSGDSHVFRFNNPVEVRKQRDRVKSHLRNVTNADGSSIDSETSTRATSPDGTHSSGPDFDWTFAQREAALARLHGLDPGLDSLPDEDLNKLFDRISKLKESREVRDQSVRLGRPESSMSGVEDMWSEYGRPVSNDALTDDTSVHGANDGDAVSDLQAQLDSQKLEFEARLGAIHESSESDDLKLEKDYMEAQLKLVQIQLKRLLDTRACGDVPDLAPFEPSMYNARQLRLIRKVLEQWRAHRSFSMSECVLSNAVLVKEANVIR